MASCALVAAFCVGLPLTAADAHVRHVHKLKLGTHVDPRPPLPAHPRRHRRIARTSTFATTWGCTEQSSDLAPLLSDAPQIKVIYAYPHGATDQLATYGSMIQADADAIRAKFNTESSGAKMVRFDVGGTGGSCTADSSNRLDIQSVELAQPASFYLDNTFDTITAELASKLVPVNPHERVNYVVYLDNVHPSDLNIAGQGDLGFDTTHGYSNAVNQGRNGNGRLFALIYGTGGADFVGGHGDDDRRTSFAHEMSHTFGAVQKTAPHTSGAGHCFDVDDIMCYDDDGPYFQNGGLLEQDCASTGFTDLALDCGKTDYFNANPPGGSYLAINWNEFDSVFLCPVSECDNNLNDPNFKVTLTPTHPGGRLTLNADAGNVAIAHYEWNVNGGPVYETDTGSSPTLQPDFSFPRSAQVEVRAVKADGTFAYASIPLSPSDPSPQLKVLGNLTTNSPITFDASATDDPDGLIQHFLWDLDGDGSFETDTGVQRSAATSYAQPGLKSVALETDYSYGQAFKFATFSVNAPAPPPVITKPVDGPSLTLSKIRLAKLLKSGLRLIVRCGNPCTVDFSLSLDAKTAKKFHLKSIKGRPVVLGRVHGRFALGTATPVLKLTARAKRALKRVRSVKMTVGGTIAQTGFKQLKITKLLVVKR